MPKKKYVHYFDVENEDDKNLEERIDYLKSNYTLDDFLKYDKTREVLEQHYIWDFDKECDFIINNFYKGEVDFCKADLSTLFNNESNYDHVINFRSIIFRHVKPKYNLDNVYYDEGLCRGFITYHEEHVNDDEEERLREQRENYKKTSNAGKTFDWGAKTYK
mgnify:CR=1 FL=1|jgi:hypothetical protein